MGQEEILSLIYFEDMQDTPTKCKYCSEAIVDSSGRYSCSKMNTCEMCEEEKS